MFRGLGLWFGLDLGFRVRFSVSVNYFEVLIDRTSVAVLVIIEHWLVTVSISWDIRVMDKV